MFPGGATGPSGPAGPRGPVAPPGPVAPRGPFIPAGPCGPGGPFAGPGGPWDPCAPSAPLLPAKPLGPRGQGEAGHSNIHSCEHTQTRAPHLRQQFLITRFVLCLRQTCTLGSFYVATAYHCIYAVERDIVLWIPPPLPSHSGCRG